MLAEAVRREAGRVLPVSLDQLYLAYQRIPVTTMKPGCSLPLSLKNLPMR